MKNFLAGIRLPAARPGPAIASAAAFVLTAAVIFILGWNGRADIGEFEAGKVADRDVVADRAISYVDEEATAARNEAGESLVPAVFKYSVPVNEAMRQSYENFSRFSQALFAEGGSEEEYRQRAAAEFPALAGAGPLLALYRDEDRAGSLEKGRAVLDYLAERGIFDLSGAELTRYNPDFVELLHNYGARIEREQVETGKIITLDKAAAALERYCRDAGLSRTFVAGAGGVILEILRENVFFSPEDTEQRLAEARDRLEPVYRSVERGEKIIRKGFIVTGEEMAGLRALDLSRSRIDPRLAAAKFLTLLLVYAALVFLTGKRSTGKLLSTRECYMMIILSAAYLTGAAFARRANLPEGFPVSLLLPTALVVILPDILIGFPVAVVGALVLPLGALLTESFDTAAYILALASGLAAAYAIRGAEKRMDLVRASLVIAGANLVAALTILLYGQAPAANVPPVLFWAAFNGLVSGLLVIGVLPLAEQALDAATPFRLIELSDLNSPVLKRLFNSAPGTYSHSLMVANLAESACQDIGANALLARVGAYYHDIGKMEQSEYFVENQKDYNKHKDISPRHSAMVIRNHVKLGLEKARKLRLPAAVTAFISEHHGNSLITWFYNEALKKEGKVNALDFTYPGTPPRSRESAVVMLADISEAAVRTLKKPTPEKLDSYLQGLFDGKAASGQLSQSELTFRDLDIIKRAFIKVFTGYYHSRIEYPKVSAETLKTVADASHQAEKGETRPAGETPAGEAR